MSLAGPAASVHNLMIAGRKHCEQRPNINKRLHEGLSINGFRSPLNAKEGCVDLIVKILLFGHTDILTLAESGYHMRAAASEAH